MFSISRVVVRENILIGTYISRQKTLEIQFTLTRQCYKLCNKCEMSYFPYQSPNSKLNTVKNIKHVYLKNIKAHCHYAPSVCQSSLRQLRLDFFLLIIALNHAVHITLFITKAFHLIRDIQLICFCSFFLHNYISSRRV